MSTEHHRPVHVVPSEVTAFDHRANRDCRCSPVPMRDLLIPSRPVWLHRNPQYTPQEKNR